MAARSEGSAVVDRLKLELHERMNETLHSVCVAFQQELELAAQPPDPSQVDYDTYNDCCQRFVRYIAANMDTSPYFTQQMDRIILACHSNTSEQVLGSLVTKDVWLRPRDTHNNGEERVSVNSGAVVAAVEAKGTVVKVENAQMDAASSSGGLPMRAEAKADPSRSGRSRTLARKSIAFAREPLSTSASAVATGNKKRFLETRPALPAKRQRQEEDRGVIDILSSAEEADDGEESGEVDIDEELFGGADADTETEDESSSEVEVDVDVGNGDEEDEDWIESEDADDAEKEAATRRPIVDPVGMLCHPERRSPRQTKVFKDRLNKGIQILDALLCKPSLGKLCLRNCQKLRREWCQNVDEIDQLAEDLQKEERLLHAFNMKRKELREKLYTIGIDESDDIIDGFPDFTAHYETKRRSRK
ncbi:hypothetical protein PRIC2_008760 [Phytophthora ramorum]